MAMRKKMRRFTKGAACHILNLPDTGPFQPAGDVSGQIKLRMSSAVRCAEKTCICRVGIAKPGDKFCPDLIMPL